MSQTVPVRAFSLLLALLLCGACSPENNGSADVDGGSADVGEDASIDSRGDVPAAEFEVMTFNTSRFFDTTCDSGACGDADFERQYSQAEFDFKVQQIADGIAEVGADAVLLQEIETEGCLDALLTRLPEYTVAEFGEIGGTATLDVAVLVRDVDFLETRRHRARTELMLDDGRTRSFARELLEVHVQREGRRIVLFAAHFKAKRNDDPEWRLAEARGAREIALATADEFPEALVILGGDLNDGPGSEPIEALVKGDELELVTDDIAPDDAWTYRYFGDTIAIDHLLLADNGGGRYQSGTAAVIRDASGAFASSDHAAVAASFEVFLK